MSRSAPSGVQGRRWRASQQGSEEETETRAELGLGAVMRRWVKPGDRDATDQAQRRASRRTAVQLPGPGAQQQSRSPRQPRHPPAGGWGGESKARGRGGPAEGRRERSDREPEPTRHGGNPPRRGVGGGSQHLRAGGLGTDPAGRPVGEDTSRRDGRYAGAVTSPTTRPRCRDSAGWCDERQASLIDVYALGQERMTFNAENPYLDGF